MTSSFIPEMPIQFYPSLAMDIGVNEAIVLQQIHFWLDNSELVIFQNSSYWIQNIYERCSDRFLMWSQEKVAEIIDGLITRGCIIVQHSESLGKLFTIDREHMSILDER